MRLNMDKVEAYGETWVEYLRLASFFSDAHSWVYIQAAHEALARARYDQLHGYFHTH